MSAGVCSMYLRATHTHAPLPIRMLSIQADGVSKTLRDNLRKCVNDGTVSCHTIRTVTSRKYIPCTTLWHSATIHSETLLHARAQSHC